jgi:hypothetical protein
MPPDDQEPEELQMGESDGRNFGRSIGLNDADRFTGEGVLGP